MLDINSIRQLICSLEKREGPGFQVKEACLPVEHVGTGQRGLAETLVTPPQLCDAGVNAMGSLAAQEGQGLCSWSWCEASTLLLLCYFLLQY